MATKNFIVLALAASPLVAAHGKIAVVTGDAGGNGTALAIMGGVVPGPGTNKVTEVDTTVFGKTNIQTDGLGKTTGQGKVKTAMISSAMAQSGATLPQVNSEVSGVFHVVTSDGCGPIQAVVDPTGTGAFSTGTMLTTTQDLPGKNGQCPRSITKKSYIRSVLENTGVITRRATNVNMDFPVKFSVPAGTTCTGTVGGQSNVCLVKIANNNKAGPFGGVVPIQVAGAATPAQPAPNAVGTTGAKKARTESPNAVQTEGAKKRTESPNAVQTEGAKKRTESPNAVQTEGAKKRTESPNAVQTEGAKKRTESPNAVQTEGAKKRTESPNAVQTEGAKKARTESPNAVQTEGAKKRTESPNAVQTEGAKKARTESPNAVQTEGAKKRTESPNAVQTEGAKMVRSPRFRAARNAAKSVAPAAPEKSSDGKKAPREFVA